MNPISYLTRPKICSRSEAEQLIDNFNNYAEVAHSMNRTFIQRPGISETHTFSNTILK